MPPSQQAWRELNTEHGPTNCDNMAIMAAQSVIYVHLGAPTDAATAFPAQGPCLCTVTGSAVLLETFRSKKHVFHITEGTENLAHVVESKNARVFAASVLCLDGVDSCVLSLCLTDGSFATLHVPMKPQNWHGPVSCHTHATSATDGPRVPQFEPPCASLPHAIGGDRVVQAACSSLGVIDLLTYTPSSGTRRLAALQWPVPHRQKPGGRGSASKEDASHVLAMEFMPLAGGTDILGNALLCVLHRDTSPVLPVPVVHLTCAALGCSSATLERGPWCLKNVHPMTSSISRVDGPRRGILVLDPASVAFLAPEGPLWRCTVPEGAIPAAAIPFFDMGSILVLSSGGGAPFWIDTVTGAPRHVLPGTAPLTQGPFALPASRVAALSHLQRVGPQICPDVAAVTTPGGAALLIAGAKSSVASGAVAEGKGEIQFWHRPGQPGTVPLRPVRAMCVMRMGAHRHTPSLASASGASHERPIPWAPSGPAAALGGVEFALGCGSGHESALFVGGVGWGVEEVGVQRVECGKAPSKMFVVQTRGAPGDLTFVVLAFDAPPETSILALDATGAWHDVSNAVSGVFPPSDPPLAAWALHGASASASDTTTLGVATPLGVVSVSLSPAASPDGGASTVSRTRAAKVGTWAPPAGRRLSIAAGDRDGMVACVQSVAYLLEAEGGQGDRIRLVGTWSLPGEASCAACVAVSSPETDPSKTDTWVAVGTWGGAGERAAVFLGRLRSANPAVCLDAGSVGPLRSICMVGARAGSGEDCRGWCVAGTADGRVAGRRFEFGEGEGRRTEESTTQSWAVMQVGHAPCEVSALPWSPGGSRAANGADRVICAAGGQCLAVEATERRLTTHRVVGWQRATCIRTACAAPAGVEEERPEEGKEGGVGIRWGEGAVVFGCDDSGVISLGTLVAQSQTRFRAVLQGEEVLKVMAHESSDTLIAAARADGRPGTDIVLIQRPTLSELARVRLETSHVVSAMCCLSVPDPRGGNSEMELVVVASVASRHGVGRHEAQDFSQLPHDSGVLSVFELQRAPQQGVPQDLVSLTLHASLPLPSPPSAVSPIRLPARPSGPPPSDPAAATAIASQVPGGSHGSAQREKESGGPGAANAAGAADASGGEEKPASDAGEGHILVAMGPRVALIRLRIDPDGVEGLAEVERAREALRAEAKAAGSAEATERALMEALGEERGGAEGEGGVRGRTHSSTRAWAQRASLGVICSVEAPEGGAVTELWCFSDRDVGGGLGVGQRAACWGAFEEPFVVRAVRVGSHAVLALCAATEGSGEGGGEGRGEGHVQLVWAGADRSGFELVGWRGKRVVRARVGGDQEHRCISGVSGIVLAASESGSLPALLEDLGARGVERTVSRLPGQHGEEWRPAALSWQDWGAPVVPVGGGGVGAGGAGREGRVQRALSEGASASAPLGERTVLSVTEDCVVAVMRL